MVFQILFFSCLSNHTRYYKSKGDIRLQIDDGPVVLLVRRCGSSKVNHCIRIITSRESILPYLNEVARAVNLTPQHLSNLFHLHTGFTFTEYCNAVRINKGAFLLLNSSLTIEEIAHKVGFSSSSYFSKIFKKLVGITPQNFRFNQENKSQSYQ